MIKIRVFRAVDEPETCQRWIEGHVKLLTLFGITSITSAKPVWVTDPATYVILAESLSGDKVLGGARVQISHGTTPLPLEEATGRFDARVYNVVKQYGAAGTGELCGLWNSREVAGMGIGSSVLGRVGVAIAPQLKITSLFALCAPYTVESCKRAGFAVETTIGKEGTFYYPKENLVATAVVLRDVNTLATASELEKEYILSLRNAPVQTKKEMGRRGEFEIDFDLRVPSFHFNDPEVFLHDGSKTMTEKVLVLVNKNS